jgi:hypothetical protein
MSEHLQNIMNMDDDSVEAESSTTKSTGQDRINSIMDMDYDTAEQVEDPEDDGVKNEAPLNSKADPEEKEEKKEEKKPEPKEKEEKEEKKEEKKAEAEKKKYAYKADGEDVEEELTDEELKSRLSGSRAIQKRFTELDQQKKQVLQKEQEANETVNYVKSEMGSLRDSFSKDIEEFKTNGMVKGNPAKSIYNLLDKMGLDTAQFEKALFFHHLPEAAKFLDMGDAERDAFLLGRENEWLRKKQDAIKGQEREVQETRAKLEQENSLKRQAGVSEELFSELKEELAAKTNLKDLKTEQVLEWHKVKPFYTRAESMAQKVQGADVHKIARILLEFPDTTDEWMLEQLGYKAQEEKKIVDQLAAKAPKKSAVKKADDDESDELWNSFRRR